MEIKERHLVLQFSSVPTVGRGPVPRVLSSTVARGPVPREPAPCSGNRRARACPSPYRPAKKSAKDRPPPYAENNVSRSLKVCKTLMSIAAQTQNALRSFRSLIGFAMGTRVFIKDLKDLENSTKRFL